VQLALEMILCLAGSVVAIVDAQDDRDVLVLRGRGDNDLLHGVVHVSVRAGLALFGVAQRVGEDSRALNDHLDSVLLPRNLARVLLRVDGDPLAVNDNRALLAFTSPGHGP